MSAIPGGPIQIAECIGSQTISRTKAVTPMKLVNNLLSPLANLINRAKAATKAVLTKAIGAVRWDPSRESRPI